MLNLKIDFSAQWGEKGKEVKARKRPKMMVLSSLLQFYTKKVSCATHLDCIYINCK
jgi:hypothetical protein